MDFERAWFWLEGFRISGTIRESMWVFPVIETLHVVTLAMTLYYTNHGGARATNVRPRSSVAEVCDLGGAVHNDRYRSDALQPPHVLSTGLTDAGYRRRGGGA